MVKEQEGKSVLADLYGSASTLLRDIQMYVVPGAVFLVLIAYPLFFPEDKIKITWLRESEIVTKLNVVKDTWNAWAIAALFTLAAYTCGHLLSGIGSCMKEAICCKDKDTDKDKEKNPEKETVLKRCLQEIAPNSNKLLSDKYPVHLCPEMKVFADRPDIHAKFIERYNVLRYMRRTLAVAFGLAGIVYLLFACHCSTPTSVFCGLGILLIVAAIAFWHSAIKTGKSFNDRVFTAFFILEEHKNTERSQPENVNGET
jgi:hypothetical protein